jgi:predicted transcriptional regulator YheO
VEEPDFVLAAPSPVLDGPAATFGPHREVVPHDYRRPDGSVVAVSGEVTGRAPGGAMSPLGLDPLAQEHAARDQVNYLTRTEPGRVIKASTMLLRDHRRRDLRRPLRQDRRHRTTGVFPARMSTSTFES